MKKNVIFALFLLIGCQITNLQKIDFSKYTKQERDSIANHYNELSDYMIQPTLQHRLFKDTAILYAPNNVEYQQVLSYSYKKRGEHLKAMEILNKAVDLDIKQGRHAALEYRAWSLLYYYRDYEGCLKDIEQIKTMSKSKYTVCWGEPCGLIEAQALYRLNDFKKAITVLDLVYEEEKKRNFSADENFLVHFYKGRCHHELGELDQAKLSYQKVIDYDASYSEALFQLGRIAFQQGNKIKAKEYYEKALYYVKRGKRMKEPYFERFDQLYEYQINEAIAKL